MITISVAPIVVLACIVVALQFFLGVMIFVGWNASEGRKVFGLLWMMFPSTLAIVLGLMVIYR